MKTFLITIGFIIIILWIYKLFKYDDYDYIENFNIKIPSATSKPKNDKSDISNNPIKSETKPGMNVGIIAIISIFAVIIVGIIIYYIIKSSSTGEEEDYDKEETSYRGDGYYNRGYSNGYGEKKDYKEKKDKKEKGKSLLGKTTDLLGDTYNKYKANKRRINRIKYNEPRANKDYSIFNAILPVLLATTPAIRNTYNSRFECIDYNSPDAKKINALYEGSTPNITEKELDSVKTLNFVDNNMLNKWFKEKNFNSKDFQENKLQNKQTKKEGTATAKPESKKTKLQLEIEESKENNEKLQKLRDKYFILQGEQSEEEKKYSYAEDIQKLKAKDEYKLRALKIAALETEIDYKDRLYNVENIRPLELESFKNNAELAKRKLTEFEEKIKPKEAIQMKLKRNLVISGESKT
jgi:hypothetical protein